MALFSSKPKVNNSAQQIAVAQDLIDQAREVLFDAQERATAEETHAQEVAAQWMAAAQEAAARNAQVNNMLNPLIQDDVYPPN